MAKKPALNLGQLGNAAGETHNPVDVLEKQQAGGSKSRIGKVGVTGWFPKATRTKLKKLAVDREITSGDLLEEALEDLFKKYGVGG